MAGSENRMLISDDVFHFQVRHVQAITGIMVMAIVLVGTAIAVTVTAREV